MLRRAVDREVKQGIGRRIPKGSMTKYTSREINQGTKDFEINEYVSTTLTIS